MSFPLDAVIPSTARAFGDARKRGRPTLRRMPTPAHLRPPGRPRSGISIVEVLVALMLVCIGLLGIAGSTALALRTTLDSANRREAVQRVATRFALLSSAGCDSARGGRLNDPTHQLTEQWTVSAAGPHFALVTDSVRWMSARGPRHFALQTAIPC